MNRRDFILNSCTACLGATAVSGLLASCGATRYTSGKLGKDGLTINVNEFKIHQQGEAKFRTFIVVRDEALQYPVYVYRFNETTYTALWMRCSHQGAELQASDGYLQCPAHGSEFNKNGQVVNGPADENLRSFPVTLNNNELFIDLRKP